METDDTRLRSLSMNSLIDNNEQSVPVLKIGQDTMMKRRKKRSRSGRIHQASMDDL